MINVNINPKNPKDIEYAEYIITHRANVLKAMYEYGPKICQLLDINEHELHMLAINHDISKFSEEEFDGYRKYYYPLDGEDKEEASKALDYAWLHHKNSNKHHWDYWIDGDGTSLEIPNKYLAELILDWASMSYRFGDTPLEYYESNKSDIKLNDKTRELLEKVLSELFKK